MMFSVNLDIFSCHVLTLPNSYSMSPHAQTGGASQKKNTLLLNMNRYTQYSPTGVVDCDVSLLNGFSIAEDLSNQACALSLAKDKSAYVRVGGGENWDKVYRAVQKANKAQEQEGGEYKYHVVGGGAGTVSPRK